MNRSGAPTTYNRITPDRGCGFILKRIWDLTEDPTNTFPPSLPTGPNPTKQDVYRGTKWANRPGFASLLWSSLIKDGLIESNGGVREYKYYKFYQRSSVGTRAVGRGEGPGGVGYTVRYRLTDKGRKVFMEMMERITETYMKKKLFGDLDKTIKTEVPPGPAERKDETWQKLDAIINDLKNLRDSLS